MLKKITSNNTRNIHLGLEQFNIHKIFNKEYIYISIYLSIQNNKWFIHISSMIENFAENKKLNPLKNNCVDICYSCKTMNLYLDLDAGLG